MLGPLFVAIRLAGGDNDLKYFRLIAIGNRQSGIMTT